MIKTFAENKFKTALLILILAANAAFLKIEMLGQFDPFDYGAFMDLAWRIMCGQHLYTDVITHVQPVFPHVMALFFKLFGYGRTGAFAQMIASSSLMIFAVYSMVRSRLPWYALFLVIALTMTGFYWNYPFPTYNQESFLFGILGVWALFSQVPFRTGRQAFWASFAAGFAAVFSAMTKINIGAIFSLTFVAAVLTGKEKKSAFLGLTLGVFAGLAGVYAMVGDVKEFLSQNFLYASNQKSRFGLFALPQSWLVDGYWVPVAAVTALLNRELLKFPEKVLLFYGLFLTAIFHYHTSSMFIPSHIPLMGALVGMGWSLILDAKKEGTFSKITRNIIFLILTVFCFYQIAQSADFALKIAFGKKHPNNDLHSEYTIKTEPLKGFRGPQVWGEALDSDLADYLRQNVAKNDELFIMAPLQPLYAMTGHESYRKVTYEFKYGAVPAPGEHVQRIKNRIISDPPEWILTYKDESPFPLNAQFFYMELQNFILKNYVIEKSWGAIGLLKRK